MGLETISTTVSTQPCTFYDGLITGDEGMADTYNHALTLLRDVFDCRDVSADRCVLVRPGKAAARP